LAWHFIDNIQTAKAITELGWTIPIAFLKLSIEFSSSQITEIILQNNIKFHI